MVMQDQLRAGDEIITAGGLHATVRSIEDDVLEIELAPETVARLDRRAVAAIVSERETEPEPRMPHPEQQIPPDDG
jgi:preprotein translocase YajC subunit